MLRLTQEREQRGWSRAELARRANVHPADLGKFELERTRPYPGQLGRIAKALGIPQRDAEALLEEVAPVTPPTAAPPKAPGLTPIS